MNASGKAFEALCQVAFLAKLASALKAASVRRFRCSRRHAEQSEKPKLGQALAFRAKRRGAS